MSHSSLHVLAFQGNSQHAAVYEWAPAIAAFVRSPYMKGHRIVPLGHSAGAGAMFVEKKYLKNTKCLPDGYFRMLTTKEFPVSELPYVSLILVEPTMVSKELYEAHIDDRNATMDFTVGATTVRRDAWPSREEAFKWLSKRFPWQVWDPRVVRLLTVGTPAYSHVIFLDNRRYDRNTVFKTPLHHQAASSSNAIGGKKQSRILILRDILRLQRRWDTFVMRFPFTLFGVARNISCKFPQNCPLSPSDPYLVRLYTGSPDYIQDSLSDVSQGRVAASVARVEGAAHMVRLHPELHPD